MIKSRYQEISPYITKDGSEIRELLHPSVHGNRNQSLAEAIIPAGKQSILHRHNSSEEIYHITSGHGVMQLGEKKFEIRPGDTIAIPAGMPHAVENYGKEPLKLLCSCSPPYSHEDTELVSL